MDKNKLIIILAVALVVAIGAVVYVTFFKDKIGGKTEQTMKVEDQITSSDGKITSGLMSDKKEFTDATGTYSIEFPKDWVVVGKDKITTTGAIYDLALIDKNDINIFVGINGPQDKDYDYETNLEGLLDLVIQKLEKTYTEQDINMEIIEKEVNTTDNYAYTYILTKLTKDDKTNYQIQKNIIGTDKLVVFTAPIPANKYEANKDTILKIINSFELK